MNKEELIAWMESELGLRLSLDLTGPSGRYYNVLSPKGDPLFTITVFEAFDGTWRFGGTSDHLTHFWEKFLREEKP